MGKAAELVEARAIIRALIAENESLHDAVESAENDAEWWRSRVMNRKP